MINTIPNTTELELEQILISKIIMASEDASNGNPNDDSLSLGGVIVGLSSEIFTMPLHRDIFNYYCQNIKKGVYPKLFYLQRFICGLPQYQKQQATIRSTILGIFNNNYFANIISSGTLETVVQDLTKIHQENKVKSALNKDVLDFDYLGDLLKDLNVPKVSAADKLKSSIDNLLNATSPYDAALIKRQLRQGMGLTPQEIVEVVEAEALASIPAPQAMSLANFLKIEFGSSNWIYPQLIPASGCVLLNGLPGSMKTMFAYACLFAYLNGLSFLGEQPSALANNPKKRGLIINADQSAPEAQEMIDKSPTAWAAQGMCDIIGGNPQDRVWTLQYLPILEKQIKVMGYTMIIVDSYVRIHSHLPKWDENKAEGALGMNAFQELAAKYGCTFLVIHHAGKDENARGINKGRGATYIPGAASAVMGLESPKPDRNGNHDPLLRFLEISKLRNATASKSTIRFNPQTYSFDLLPDNQGQERTRLNHIADNLYQQVFLQNSNEKYTVERIMSSLHVEVGGDRKAFAYKILNKLEQRGLINKSVDPHDHKRRLYSFKIQNPEKVLDEEVAF